ncbi:beta-lactamase/transpeptidase-like protein [Mycena rebaudengoi]|nr:beta-lactamase/transpeptidase-like protein [Mycena rebaudengoi]
MYFQLFDILATGLLISNTSLTPQISWKTKIASILPTWKLMDPVASAGSTITDLMSHRTGLPRHDFMYSMSENASSVIKRLQYLKPSTGFREDLQYTNLMYIVLSYLPTALVPGRPSFERYVKEHIFDPLGLNPTTYSFAAANGTGRMADGVFWTRRVLSTATDMVRWLKMLLLNGQHPETGAIVIPADVIQKVATGSWYGKEPLRHPSCLQSFMVQDRDSPRTGDMHGGDVLGFHSQVTRLPFDGIGIAVLTNDGNYGSYFGEAIKYRIIDAALGLDAVDWSARYQASVSAAVRIRLNATTTPPGVPLPPSTITSMARKYRNPGYGPDIELCAIDGGASASTSTHCAALTSHLNTTFPTYVARATLVWEWDRLAGTYARLTHFKGAVFNVSGWLAVPMKNTSFAEYFLQDSGMGDSTVEFAFNGSANGKVKGFGIKGKFWGAMVPEEPVGEGVRGSSEVWFDAV